MQEMPFAALSELLMRDALQSENGIAVLDAHDTIVFHNPAFARQFGFQGEILLGNSYLQLMERVYLEANGAREDALPLNNWLAQVQRRHRSTRFRSFELDLANGRWLMLSEQLHDGGEVVMLASDISQHKQTELELMQAQSDLERLAHTDDLTGIPNRRYFLQQLDAELVRARRYRHPLCLAMLDLDHFKGINDHHGHAGGDQVLRHFTQFLRSHLRAVDVVGRLGGEEFAILLPETTLENALFVLRRIITLLADASLDALHPGFQYTFSAGVATVDLPEGADSARLLASADSALYQAKSAGRNCALAFVPGAAPA